VALAPRDLPVLGRIPLLSLTAKCWKNRATPNTLQMLRMLSGQTHQVMTAVALADKQQTLDCLVVTEVTFRCFRAGYRRLCGQRRTFR
jgi:septum formation protein